MTKVVYNACFGGFGLSRAAVLLARKLSGDPLWGGATIKGDVYPGGKLIVERDYGHVPDICRTDSILVQVVETLGSGKASGDCAKLAIQEVPEGCHYRIDEYDGKERVMTKDDYEWEKA